MSSNTNITIVINTCDAYSDVLKLFFAAINEYWPNNKYRIIINSEKKIYDEYNASTHALSLNNPSWGLRLIKTLESVKTEFVLMVFDDFILENFVYQDEIDSALKLISINDDISVVYLMNTKLPHKNDAFQNKFIELIDECEFRLNSYPGLWRRQDLISYTGINDNPWAWELFGSYRTFNNKRRFYTLNPIFPDIFPYNHEKGGAIYRGKWVKEIVDNKIFKYGLNINTSIRGYSDNLVYEPRSLYWKVNFFITGYRMIGLKVLKVMFNLIKSKYFAKKAN
jgi:hypothetical protein